LSCDKPVGTDRTLCPACWNRIHFIAKPFCARCGAPFEVPVDETTLCGGCIMHPPHFGAARAAMLYDDASRSLVLRFKHGDRIHTAKALASWMHRAGEEFWNDTDILIPVPLHRWRLFRRRYNQAALLTQNLAAIGRNRFLPDALLRLRPTPSQGHLNRKERQVNVKGAFGMNPKHQFIVEGKSVLLVDDVLTTGATVNECAGLLLNSGAKAVNVLVLARVKGYL
jgi:ComF family protein